MNRKRMIQMAAFNGGLILINILCFSDALFGFSIFSANTLEKAGSLTIIIMSVASFICINYKLLSAGAGKQDYNLGELDSPEEFIDILNRNRGKALLKQYIDDSVDQIQRMTRKRQALDNLLYQKFQEEDPNAVGFKTVIDDANALLLKNMKRVINLVSIFDQQEYDDFRRKGVIPPSKKEIYEENDRYLKDLLQKNETILLDFDRLMLEISKIGDTEEADEVNLQRIGDIVDGLRRLRENDDEDLIQKYEGAHTYETK